MGKVKRGLSAGRVQSVALRIIADREEEINAFIPEEYWTLDANLKVEGEKKLLRAKFYGKGNKKLTIGSREEMEQILKNWRGGVYSRRDPQRRKGQEGSGTFYNQYSAAGGIQSSEFCYLKDYEDCPAAIRGN